MYDTSSGGHIPTGAEPLASALRELEEELGIRARPEQLAERWPEGFDGVMADVPCSGEGMFRRDPETVGEWSPEKAAGCVLRQREILEAAAKLVRPGGRMVYATCTFHQGRNYPYRLHLACHIRG